MLLWVIRRLARLHLRLLERRALDRPWSPEASQALDRARLILEEASHGS